MTRTRSTRALGLALTLVLGGGVLATITAGQAPAGAAQPAAATSAASDTVPVPKLSTPPPGVHGHPLWDSWHELESFGYTQHEYFVSGTATALDGTTAPYTTRIVVFRPQEQERFNGTVMLDWVNVTAQFENAVDTLEAREMLLREGWAYVHVSAQNAGLCCTPLTPKVYDPVRYAAINHPGDAYAADMFSQIAKAIRTPGGCARPDAAAWTYVASSPPGSRSRPTSSTTTSNDAQAEAPTSSTAS